MTDNTHTDCDDDNGQGNGNGNGHNEHGNGNGYGHEDHGNGNGYGHEKHHDDDDDCPVPCYTTGTMIATPNGKSPVENLKVGDKILTADNGAQEIKWIGRKNVSFKDFANNEDLRPIRIAQGALGANMPSTDLVVSPQHRMLIKSPIAAKLFGNDEVLIPAKKLTGLKGVEVAEDIKLTAYFHFVTDKHEIVMANDAPSETLLTGKMALKAIGKEARAEIEALFPETLRADYNAVSARPIIQKTADVNALLRRLNKNEGRRTACENWGKQKAAM